VADADNRAENTWSRRPKVVPGGIDFSVPEVVLMDRSLLTADGDTGAFSGFDNLGNFGGVYVGEVSGIDPLLTVYFETSDDGETWEAASDPLVCPAHSAGRVELSQQKDYRRARWTVTGEDAHFRVIRIAIEGS
jgi:hypothetical protein